MAYAHTALPFFAEERSFFHQAKRQKKPLIFPLDKGIFREYNDFMLRNPVNGTGVLLPAQKRAAIIG